jgi:hypothetical protein
MARVQRGRSPGNSGGGAAAGAASAVENLAREHTEAAIRTLAEICGNKNAPPAARVAAATALLDRAWGKPRQPLDHSGEVPQRYVVVAPPPVASTEEWLERYAPKPAVEN